MTNMNNQTDFIEEKNKIIIYVCETLEVRKKVINKPFFGFT